MKSTVIVKYKRHKNSLIEFICKILSNPVDPPSLVPSSEIETCPMDEPSDMLYYMDTKHKDEIKSYVNPCQHENMK